MTALSRSFAAACTAILCTATAQAQDRPDPQQAAAQIATVLSLVSGGALGTSERPARITPDGDAFRVQVPLPALTPSGASLTARLKPLGDGVWDISSATLPASGSFILRQANNPQPSQLSFSIGQQMINGRIDPSLAQPSPFNLALTDVKIKAVTGADQSEQSIAHQTLQGTLSGEANNRVTLRTQGTASDWHISARSADGHTSNSQIRSAASAVEVEGLDRAKAEKFRAAAKAFVDSVQTVGADAAKQKELTEPQRQLLGAIIDALQGMLGRLNVEETLEGVHFEGPPGTEGGVSRMRFAIAGESRDDRLNANIDLTMHDLTVANVPPELATYMPTLLQLRPELSGIRSSGLLRFLHHAADGVPPDALQAEALGLLSEPGARLGIEKLSMTAGSLRIDGSGRMLPPSNGNPGVEARIIARGVDATLAKVQANPKTAKFMPLVYLAKGMARTEGDALVWDVRLVDGAVSVNGVPMAPSGPPPGGPPPGGSPGARGVPKTPH